MAEFELLTADKERVFKPNFSLATRKDIIDSDPEIQSLFANKFLQFQKFELHQHLKSEESDLFKLTDISDFFQTPGEEPMAIDVEADDEFISNQIIKMRAFKHKNNVAFGFVAPETSKRALDLIDSLDMDSNRNAEKPEVKFRTEKSKTYKSILLLKD